MKTGLKKTPFQDCVLTVLFVFICSFFLFIDY
jgi:hypothetical protein